jgi:hypothetical protein
MHFERISKNQEYSTASEAPLQQTAATEGSALPYIAIQRPYESHAMHESGVPTEHKDSVIETRDQMRSLLYGTVAEDDTNTFHPLTVLATETAYKSLYSEAERTKQAAIRAGVTAVLACHDRLARSNDAADQAIFGASTKESLAFLAEYTGEAVWRWDWACEKQGLPSPFADVSTLLIDTAPMERQDARLVVEAAAAISEIANLGYLPQKMTGKATGDFTRLITRSDPTFLAAWKRSDLLPDTYPPFLTAKELMVMALKYSQYPLQRYKEVAEKYYEIIDDNVLIAAIGQEHAPVVKSLPVSQRKLLALRYRDPVAEVERIALLLQTDLSTEVLAERYDMTTEEAERIFTPAVRLLAHFKQPTNPLARLDKSVHYISNTLKPAVIAELLAWPEEDVEQFFNINGLVATALRTPNNVIAVIKRMAKNKDYLDTSFLAAKLGKTEDDINSVFFPSTKTMLVQRTDPLAAAHTIMKVGEQVRQYGLPAGAVRLIARRYTLPSALSLAKVIQKEMNQCPPGVTREVWASAWVTYPNPADDAKRRQQVVSFYSLRSVVKPIGYNDARVGDVSAAPHTSFEATLPSDALEFAADIAGVTFDQLQRLLRHFGFEGQPPEDPELAGVFVKLQQVLRSKDTA